MRPVTTCNFTVFLKSQELYFWYPCEPLWICAASFVWCNILSFSTPSSLITDYGRIKTRSQIIYSPLRYPSLPNRKPCKMYENLSLLKKKIDEQCKIMDKGYTVTKKVDQKVLTIENTLKYLN